MRQSLTNIFKLPFLRNILFLFIVFATLIPLYEWYRAFPLFRDLLTHAAEDQAIRIASHLSSYDFFKESPLDSRQSIPKAWVEEVSMVSQDLKLDKVKLFSRTGRVIFSTESGDIHKVNNRDYFHNTVAKGHVFTKVVEKGTQSLEGKVYHRAIVETYIPIMRHGTFMGSFEVYYDIASQRASLDALLGRLNMDMVIMGIGLTLLAMALITRAAKEIHEREAAQEALRHSEKKFRGISDSAKDAIIMLNASGEINLWNNAATKMFGYRASEVLGREMHPLLLPERFLLRARQGFAAFARAGEGKMVVGKTVEMVARHKDGTEFPVEVSVNALQFQGTWHAIGILRDISARKKAEQRLKLGYRVMENAADGILVTDQHANIEMINPAFSTVTGYHAEEVLGKNPRLLKSGRHDDHFYQEMWRVVTEHGLWQGEIWNRRKNGDIYPQRISMSAIRDAEGQTSHYVAVFNDITQRKMDEANLERLAFYDPLTGIPNRQLFLERLDRAIREDNRHKTATALMFLDLDHFKQVNDNHGHEVGDLLLQEAARRLQGLVRDEDTVARLGGDEFTIILRRVSLPQDADRVASKVVTSMVQPFQIKGIECRVGASIGIACHPLHSKDVDTLVKLADTAMYVAKKGGRNNYRIYDPADTEQAT